MDDPIHGLMISLDKYATFHENKETCRLYLVPKNAKERKKILRKIILSCLIVL